MTNQLWLKPLQVSTWHQITAVLCRKACSHAVPHCGIENCFKLEAISLVDAARLRVQADTYKWYPDEPKSTTITHLGGFDLCPLASVGLKRLVPSRTSPLSGPFRVTNPKPKRWRTAIKARENQLLTLAKEALQAKKERRVIHFLDYIDQDIAA